MHKYLFLLIFLGFISFSMKLANSQSMPVIDIGSKNLVNTDELPKGYMFEHKVHLKIMRKLMTPAERLKLMDDLMDSKTPELCMTLMQENYTDLETRAKAGGFLLPSIGSTGMIFARICG
jgi:hypothetical protein